jgi:alkaline phosphatase
MPRLLCNLIAALLLAAGCSAENKVSTSKAATGTPAPKTGSVIFLHPDGSSLSAWTAHRILQYGPDGLSNWDRLERMATYTGHLRNSLVSSSNGGATVHAWGVKSDFEHYGNNDQAPLTSLSGKDYGIMVEAIKAGKPVGVINSGHIGEPGTGVFLSDVLKRSMRDEIALQIIESGADVIMSGGEQMLLPEGTVGRHGKPGQRKDGRNLIDRAGELGYAVVYNRDEMLALPDDTERVLGVFAGWHTFNAKSEEELQEKGLPLYWPSAPTVAEMTEVALRILGRKGKDFLLVVEEEGTDNFANSNNAGGTFEALRRADMAIKVVVDYIESNPNTLLITAADSDAGSMALVEVSGPAATDEPLSPRARNGAPLDGVGGASSPPFSAAPDRSGNRLCFAISWAGNSDFAGGIMVRAHGLNTELMPGHVDNTDIYRMMYATLFGKWLP